MGTTAIRDRVEERIGTSVVWSKGNTAEKVIFLIEIVSCASQVGLELAALLRITLNSFIFLTQSPKHWECRYATQYPAYAVLGIKTRALYMLDSLLTELQCQPREWSCVVSSRISMLASAWRPRCDAL